MTTLTTTETLPLGVRLVKPPERPFFVLEAQRTLILDWDIETEPREEEAGDSNTESGCCTISCTQDAVSRLEAYSKICGGQLWAVYETGKGVRAFRLDQDFPTDYDLESVLRCLDPDRNYMVNSVARQHWAARVSHKEGRPDEEIRFLHWIGTGNALPQHWEVLKCHHRLLLEHGLTDMPFSGIEAALKAHLNPSYEDYIDL
jgi:hypothetical protein